MVPGERRLSRRPSADHRASVVEAALTRRCDAETACAPFHRLQKDAVATLDALADAGPCVLILGDSLSRGPSPGPDGADLHDYPDHLFNMLAIAEGSPHRAYAPGQLLDEVAVALVRRLGPGDGLVIQDAGPHHGVSELAGLAVRRLAAAADPGVRVAAVTAPGDARTAAEFDWSRPLPGGRSPNDAVRAAARRCGAGLIDLEALRPIWDTALEPHGLRALQADGVHFTRAGGALYAAALATLLAGVTDRSAPALSQAVAPGGASWFTRLAASAMRSGRAAASPEGGATSTASRGR